jgi:signal transduction histidine kinase
MREVHKSAKLKILLIEGNREDAELLMESLKIEVDHAIEIDWVPMLKAALERLTTCKYDAVLLNLNLPDSTGLVSLLKLRKFSTDIPVIILTGLDDKDVALSCVKYGAQDYLVKGKPSDGSIYRVITYSVERCRADAAIKQLKLLEQREHFIAMLAHDLRSPITGADRIVSLILDGLAGTLSEKQQQLLSMVSGTNKTLLLMINNVLDSYRLEEGGEKFLITRLDLSALIAECLQDLEPVAQGKDIQLRHTTTVPHEVLADSMAMRRVITNLVSNALKFTPSGGCVEVIFEMEGVKASLKVKDNGIGIEPEKLPNLFERFYQADTQNRASGLGLGLHLCKHLVDAQRGTLTCESSPNKGTTFNVLLPVAYKESVKALIVDDDPVNRVTLQRMLKRLSVDSVSVSSGIEALSVTSNHSFQAIFMDIQMPGLDGYDTTRAMREAGMHAPIVAYTNNYVLKDVSESGMSDILQKPADPARVKQVVDQWLHQNQL